MEQKRNEEELNLSDMIDEYEEDHELRKKIAAMKQRTQTSDVQKAVEDDTLSFASESDSSFLSTESKQEDADKTQIMDRTVIYDRRFSDSANEDDHDSVYLYADREVDEEEITEDDIEEFLERKERDALPSQSAEANRMNKMVTVSIVAVISICLLFGIVYGVQALLGSDEPVADKSEDPKKPDKEDQKDPIKDNDDDKDKDKDKDKEPEENEGDSSIDKTKRIAEIKGMISANNAQLEVYNKKLAEAVQIRDAGSFKDELDKKNKDVDKVAADLGRVENELKKYEEECTIPQDGEDPSEFCASFDQTAKLEERNQWQTQLNEVKKEAEALKQKNDAYNKAVDDISELNAEITRLNGENEKLNEEMFSLQ